MQIIVAEQKDGTHRIEIRNYAGQTLVVDDLAHTGLSFNEALARADNLASALACKVIYV